MNKAIHLNPSPALCKIKKTSSHCNAYPRTCHCSMIQHWEYSWLNYTSSEPKALSTCLMGRPNETDQAHSRLLQRSAPSLYCAILFRTPYFLEEEE